MNKKIISFTCVVILLSSKLNLYSQPCLPEGITFSTQEQIDQFQGNYPGCTEIIGNVKIQGPDITNLSGLIMLIKIGGSLWICGNPLLSNLYGLENLQEIMTDENGYSLMVQTNYILSELTGLTQLDSLPGTLAILDNDQLVDFKGLENMHSVTGDFIIQYNAELHNLSGLDQLIHIGGDIRIRDNFSITSLSGLNNLVSVSGELCIYYNPKLLNINALSTLETVTSGITIDKNDSLESLDGLENIYSLPHLNINSNSSLTSLGTFTCLNYLGGLNISNNDVLVDLGGLDNLIHILEVHIIDNDSLISITGLHSVTGVEYWLEINGNDFLQNLAGLNNLESTGYFSILNNNSLTDLEGLDYLASIGGDLEVQNNDQLYTLTGLEHLTHIDQDVLIINNDHLFSLTGIDNVSFESKNYVNISENPNLTICDVQSLCDLLASQTGQWTIYGNAEGCNSPAQVSEACESTAIEASVQEDYFSVYPNPATTSVTIEYFLGNKEYVNITILSSQWQIMEILIDEVQEQGSHAFTWKSACLPPGVYFYIITAGDQNASGKVVLMK